MNIHFRRFARRGINKILDTVGFQLVRRDQRLQNYINLRRTIADARAAGLSVGDYIDHAFNVPGATQCTIDKMCEYGVFETPIESVCEIGPGSGRYLEKTIEICHPRRYEIYETARDWRMWLKDRYPIIAFDADGTTLGNTESHSINLVHAHKVFPGLKVFEIIRYFLEMTRVIAPAGYIVFDVLTENCFPPELLSDWLTVLPYWPCAMIMAGVVTCFFENHGSHLVGRFTIPMKPGITDYFIFRYHPSDRIG